jgi:hypothetical protein
VGGCPGSKRIEGPSFGSAPFGNAASSGYNLYYENTTNYAGVATTGTADLEVDPLLDTSVTPPGLDSGSPARSARNVAHAPADVADCETRVDDVRDLRAFEAGRVATRSKAPHRGARVSNEVKHVGHAQARGSGQLRFQRFRDRRSQVAQIVQRRLLCPHPLAPCARVLRTARVRLC